MSAHGKALSFKEPFILGSMAGLVPGVRTRVTATHPASNMRVSWISAGLLNQVATKRSCGKNHLKLKSIGSRLSYVLGRQMSGVLETHNEHSASILRALPLGMRLRNLPYSNRLVFPVSLDALSLCRRQFEPFCAPRRAAVMQQPCCSVVHVVDIGCRSCAPTALTSTRKSHLTSPGRCYTRLQRLFIAQLGLQMGAFDAMHPRSDSLLF